MKRRVDNVSLSESLLKAPPNGPVVIGTGLLTLDIVISSRTQKAPRLYAGGTCGNVLSILSYLGWKAYPVARLNGDAASKRVLSDLRAWNVRTRYATLAPQANTPIIVHQINRDRTGIPSHRFTWACPQCGAWLPGYQAVTASATARVASHMTKVKVFFMDRLSRGALLLGEASAAQGALVVFEPVSVGDPKLFREALGLAHVLKYSHEKKPAFESLITSMPTKCLLEVETLGSRGLRYRTRLSGASSDSSPEWHDIAAFQAPVFRDAAGAGDWCTAGIIHVLGQRGLQGLSECDNASLASAFRLGQAMAAWTCGFEGAREGMYAVSKQAFRSAVVTFLTDTRLGMETKKSSAESRKILKRAMRICPACSKEKKVVASNSKAPYRD